MLILNEMNDDESHLTQSFGKKLIIKLIGSIIQNLGHYLVSNNLAKIENLTK